MEYTIVPMDSTTIGQVAMLEKMCFSSPWSEKSLNDELSNDTATWLVALGEDKSVLGYGGIHILHDEGEIMNIAVHEKFRRLGIAKDILHKLLDYAKCTQSVFLEVRSSNISAIKLYENAGFEQIAVRRNYYQFPTEDALILRKTMGK